MTLQFGVLSVILQVKIQSVSYCMLLSVPVCVSCAVGPTVDTFFVTTETNNVVGSSKNSKALQTFHRVDRLSRKLQRRLTQHTLAEVKAMRQYSKDALDFVLLTLELVRILPEICGRTGDRGEHCLV